MDDGMNRDFAEMLDALFAAGADFLIVGVRRHRARRICSAYAIIYTCIVFASLREWDTT